MVVPVGVSKFKLAVDFGFPALEVEEFRLWLVALSIRACNRKACGVYLQT